MQTHVAVAHLTLQLCLRYRRRHRIDHYNIDTSGGHQRVGDFKRLLTAIGLRHDQVVHVDSELTGIAGIESMFGVDKCGRTPTLLRLRDSV